MLRQSTSQRLFSGRQRSENCEHIRFGRWAYRAGFRDDIGDPFSVAMIS
jgi:hypothetical protein